MLKKIKIKKVSYTKKQIEMYDLFIPDNHNFLVGAGLITHNSGLGKTYSVISTLNKLGLRIDKEYIIIESHLSPLMLYKILYEHSNNKLIIFDDTTILENPENISLLKSATFNPFDTRIVSWRSTSSKLGDAPLSFEFQGDLIILVNKFPKQDANFEALLNRGFVTDLNLSYKEIILLLYEIAKADYEGLNEKERLEVIEFIKANSSEATSLNLRTIRNIYEIYKVRKDDWQELAKEFLKEDEIVKALIEVENKYANPRDRVRAFCDANGYSRASYYRLRKEKGLSYSLKNLAD